MMEDCATGMSALQGCTDGMDVVESFKEALKQRVGEDRFRLWFTHGVSFSIESPGAVETEGDLEPAEGCLASIELDGSDVSGHEPLTTCVASSPRQSLVTRGAVVVRVRGAFAHDRLRNNFMRELRGAAMAACGSSVDVRLQLADDSHGGLATQTLLLPDEDAEASGLASAAQVAAGDQSQLSSRPAAPAPTRRKSERRGPGAARHGARSLASVLGDSGRSRRGGTKDPVAPRAPSAEQLPLELTPAANAPASAASVRVSEPSAKSSMTLADFIPGGCNQLAHTAASMVCQNPGIASPLFLFGSTGVGKTHLLHAIADQLRRYQRMRTVMVLSAEQFTNDFINSVNATGLPAFRRRYRDVDALLVDDVQFLESKRATLREMLFTVETLAAAGRPLVFTANQSPSEIPGLTRELAGRMAAGLVCPMQPLDAQTRRKLLEKLVAKSCPIAWPEPMIEEISGLLGGDSRVISGIVNLVGMLQRMYQRMPTLAEIREFGGDLLRSQTPTVTLNAIERAVCETFGLEQQSLREPKHTRSITEPRMLAMYLSRQMTPAAYNEISRHYHQKSHTSAILASKKVEQWLATGKSLGRGPSALSARQALDRIESILRAS